MAEDKESVDRAVFETCSFFERERLSLKLADKGEGGVLLRDHTDAFRGGACYFFPEALNLEFVEILACQPALQLAEEKNVQLTSCL